jgi:hypothetical protein
LTALRPLFIDVLEGLGCGLPHRVPLLSKGSRACAWIIAVCFQYHPVYSELAELVSRHTRNRFHPSTSFGLGIWISAVGHGRAEKGATCSVRTSV